MIGLVLSFLLKQISKRKLPKIEGELKVAGLIKPVEVIRDTSGVPHIFASNKHDLFFAQGFVQAQDRFWQMELNRRTANGTLSEIFGEIALETDVSSRTFGFSRLGIQDYRDSTVEVKEILQAFTEGVNAFLKGTNSKLPVEFTLLRYKPEPWRPEDTSALSRLMLWQLSHAWLGEIVKKRIIDAVGAEKAAELEIIYPKDNPCTLPEGIEFNVFEGDILKAFKGPFLHKSQGSNGWAISKEKSDTNHAYLCNDMHLALMLPGIWYETHLESPDFHVTGVSLPGMPLILVGHNDSIAWGSTLAFTDAEDVFIEKFNPDNPNQYEFRGQWEEAEVIKEEFNVKGKKEPIIENIILTRHGPIISKAIGYQEKRIAVNSMALKPSKALQGYLQLNLAKNWDDFVSSMKYIDSTQLNMVYADIEDNIGYWVTGRVPIRAKGDGTVPVPGWTGEYEWIGEVPFEEMPHALNPKQGYIITCNHKIISDDYPYYLGKTWMNGYRAKRFVQLIQTKEKFGVNDFKAFHRDFMCLPALEFIKHIIEVKDKADSDTAQAIELLENWDGYLSADSVAGTIYEVSRYFMVRTILEKSLDKDLINSFMGEGFSPVLYHANEFFGHDVVVLLRFLDNSKSSWIVEAGGKEQVVLSSLKKTVEWLKKNMGKKPENWQWGKLHRATFNHALSLQKPLDKVFNRGNIPVGGNTDTLCQTASHSDGHFKVNAWAPSHRQIIDMSNFSNSLIIAPPGQSGHLASPHYDDMIKDWASGVYRRMLWTRSEIENNIEGKLVLNPD